MNSQVVKQWAEAQIDTGVNSIVVDMEMCLGMDSTFMGNLAGMAMKLTQVSGGLLIADATEKCVSSLEELGISSLMKINPTDQIWQDRKVSIRERLTVIEESPTVDKAMHVYETHKKLCEADTSNEEKFSAVLECLEAEISNKKTD